MDNNTVEIMDIELLANSIPSALDLLYEFCVMRSENTLDDNNSAADTLFTIKVAAEKLSEMITALKENNGAPSTKKSTWIIL